jgi:hypothetical protein
MNTALIKSFCIDFNWDAKGPAAPGMYADADLAGHLRWYRELGANVIQTFCVSYNGYAWYADSNVAPVIPGLRYDFLPEITTLAHSEGMRVMGYFCLGANPLWEAQHPEQFHREVDGNTWRIVLTGDYLDYFCASVRDALEQTEVDGFMIDWFNRPQRKIWLECEKTLFRELMGGPMPAGLPLDSAEAVEFDRRLLERAWVRIRETVESTRKVIVWTNHPFTVANDPLWNGHRLLREVDWVLNEDPKVELLGWLEAQVGPHTKIIQNLCGWKDHDASIWRQLDARKLGFYGFAQADPVSTLPSPDYTPACAANWKNIGIIREAYQTLAEHFAIPGSH